VALELDKNRYEGLVDKSRWEKLPLRTLIKGRNVYFFMAQAFLTNMQQRLGRDYGVEPGSEMEIADKQIVMRIIHGSIYP